MNYLTFISTIATLLSIASVVFAKIYPHYIKDRSVLRNPLTYYVLICNLIITTCLPLSLWCEFPAVAGSKYAPFSFYYQYYPHIVIYPALLFGFASLFVTRAALHWWGVSKKAMIARVLLAIAVASGAVYFEGTGGYLMLLEFNKDAQSSEGHFGPEILPRAKAAGVEAAFAKPMLIQIQDALTSKKGDSAIAKALANYDHWERLGEGWQSDSRPIYLAMFFYIIFTMVLGYSMLPPVKRLVGNDPAIDSLISIDLAGALVVFLMWMPFRMYYNLQTKIPIFGSQILDNFFGKIPFFSVAGLTPSEVAPIFVIIGFLFFLIIRGTDIPRKSLIVILTILSGSAIVGSAILAVFKPDIFAEIYGIQDDLKYIVFRILFLSLLLLFIYSFITWKFDVKEGTP